MKIILSPTKKMITDTDSIAPVGLPEFLDKTTEILSWLQGKSKEELKAIWKCNDKIAEQNIHRLEYMDENTVCILWCAETDGWGDTLSFGNAGEYWNRRCQEFV